ncbi:MAG: hypothetical protein OEZ10_08845 [Gammaproteobacteria bacterium]|nr:hypothetical protein [Gammaproteobacteria bacterium]
MKHFIQILCAGLLSFAFPVLATDSGVDTKTGSELIADVTNSTSVRVDIDSTIPASATPSRNTDTVMKTVAANTRPSDREILTVLKINGI